MAVAPTGAIFKALEFDNESSRKYGIYITGEAVYNAPERDVDMVKIPGRNGELALDNGRFHNIPVKYKAGVHAANEEEFAKAVSDFRNFLCSRKGYCRLTDDYNPDEYRLGVYKSGLEVSAEAIKAGQFDIIFDCMPQRWLTSGEEEMDMADWSDVQTISGDVVNFDANEGTGVKSASAEFEYEQDGEPWASDTESVPYLFRPSSGSAVTHDYDRETGNIIGATVNWNQQIYNGDFSSNDGWMRLSLGDAISIANGEVTINVNSNFGGMMTESDAPLPTDIIGHKYLISADIKASTLRARIGFGLSSAGSSSPIRKEVAVGTSYQNYSFIGTQNTATVNGRFMIYDINGSDGVTLYAKNIFAIDLTALFGSSETADYVYALEQANARAGVAWLRQHFPMIFEGYHAYDTGTLKSVEGLVSHDTVGFNQWDEEWEVIGSGEYARLWSKNYIPVLPNTTYYFRQATPNNLKGHFYDADKNIVSEPTIYRNATFITPENAYYMKFNEFSEYGTTYNHDICINISDPSRNGEYEPYKRNSYPLDSSVTLRGTLHLDANNKLYADGDVYPPSGQIGRNFGIVDLGTLNYSYKAAQGNELARFELYASPILHLKTPSNNYSIANMICSNYQTRDFAGSAGMTQNDKSIGLSSLGWLGITDSAYSDATAFKTAMSGVYLVYELATPSTETAEPYQAIQAVDPYGTEEFVIDASVDVPVPVGHQTKYHEEAEIIGTTEVSVYISPTEMEDDATEYTTPLGATYASGTLDIVSGELTIDTGYIGSYNGETINEPWVSSLDPYVSGTTPSIGAQVAYPLTIQTTITLTGEEIQTLLGKNYMWSSLGNITVKYGDQPGYLTNPTLFDAQPLIETWGFGNIQINNSEISLNDEPLGAVSILGPTSLTRTGTVYPNYNVCNQGDLVDVEEIAFEYEVMLDDGQTLSQTPSPSWQESGTGNIGTAAVKIYDLTSNSFKIRFGLTGLKIYKGVPFGGINDVAKHTIEVNYETIEGGEATARSLPLGINIRHTANDVTAIWNRTEYTRVTVISRTVDGMIANSTMSILGTPTYIDCGIGEAYKIEEGTFISLNRSVDLGSDLPELSPGANLITFDNTFTQVKVVPNWWKV